MSCAVKNYFFLFQELIGRYVSREIFFAMKIIGKTIKYLYCVVPELD